MWDADVAARRYYALVILGIVLPFLLTPFLSLIFLSTDQSLVYRLTCSRFLIWAVLGLMFLYASQAEIQPFFLWPEAKYGFLFYFGSVIVLFLIAFASSILAHIPVWLGLHEKNDMLHKMIAVMKQYPSVLVFSTVTAGVTEELVFRAYMIPRLSLFFKSSIMPVIISASLFSAIHIGYKNVGELLFALFFGLAFGYHYQKYRNIKVLVAVHFLWDFIVSLIATHHKLA